MAEENGNGAVENDGPMNDAPAEERAREDSTTDTAEVAALQAELAAMKERALRALADAENTRKRAERERDDARLYAITRFARDLLSVSDNLSRALIFLEQAQALPRKQGVKVGIVARRRLGIDVTCRQRLQRPGERLGS